MNHGVASEFDSIAALFKKVNEFVISRRCVGRKAMQALFPKPRLASIHQSGPDTKSTRFWGDVEGGKQSIRVALIVMFHAQKSMPDDFEVIAPSQENGTATLRSIEMKQNPRAQPFDAVHGIAQLGINHFLERELHPLRHEFQVIVIPWVEWLNADFHGTMAS